MSGRGLVYDVALPSDRRLVALTFDDGPSRWTEPMLDVLRRHRSSATFFVLGRALDRHREAPIRAVREGHELGNHLYSHRRPETLDDESLLAELDATRARLRGLVGVDARLVRPPYGADADRVARIAKRAGVGPTIMWSFSPKDWREKRARTISESVLANLRPGAIFLLHDGLARRGVLPASLIGGRAGTGTRRPTIDAVDQILRALDERGYRSVTVSELLDAGREG